uniref:Uncharacterized protein n=1 Tax=Anguilla anguilla TaxID=7936 RepID=A0A0E9VW23_ANGAN
MYSLYTDRRPKVEILTLGRFRINWSLNFLGFC